MSQRRTAIVIGAGMSGLVAARVLAGHFERVVVIDRDELPADQRARVGVPQAHHTHVLLSRGVQILERLFPGLQADLHAAGAPAFNFGTDLAFRTYYGWAVRPFGNFPGHRCTRTLLEACVRAKLRELAPIELVPKTAATGLITRNGNVVGVDTKHGQLDGDLVMEASGKASKTLQWIASLGYTLPKPSVVDGLAGYATRIFKIPENADPDWRALYIQGSPGKPGGNRGGSLFPIEGALWHVTVAGYAREYPPVDPAGFLEYVRNFRVPDLYNAIRGAEPVGQIFGSRSTENRHLHLERAKAWPRGFLVMGDAAVHLNPVYAQGMTLAAMAGEALDLCLGRGDDRLPERFHAALDRVVQGAWALATSMDFRVPEWHGDPQPPGFPIIARYMDQLMKLGCYHRPTAERFAEVLHLVREPASLLTPRIFFPALVATPPARPPHREPASDRAVT